MLDTKLLLWPKVASYTSKRYRINHLLDVCLKNQDECRDAINRAAWPLI